MNSFINNRYNVMSGSIMKDVTLIRYLENDKSYNFNKVDNNCFYFSKLFINYNI